MSLFYVALVMINYLYQKEDLSEVTFGVSKIDSSTVNYYYEIKSDIRGERHEN